MCSTALCVCAIIVIVVVIYLLTLHISILLRVDSEERTVFLGGHPVEYSPTNVCAVCAYASVSVSACPKFFRL
jgi:hypothetical protein